MRATELPYLRSGRALLLATLLSGCSGYDPVTLTDDVQVGERRAPIVNGTSELGHEAVGAITTGGSLCTATLIGKKTVLTASHCVTPGRNHYFVAANQYWIADSVHRHPQYGGENNPDNDVAVVLLRNAPPVKAAFAAVRAPDVGQDLTLVGYGATTTEGAGAGVKRIGLNRVAYVTPTRIVISGSGGGAGNLCFGDSGGPTFATIDGNEVQVGVHSTIAGACGVQGHDMRVDVYLEWIRQTAGGDVNEGDKASPFLDEVPPDVRISSPAEGAEVANVFTLEAEITDEFGVAKADLLVDGEPLDELQAAPFTFALKLEQGPHELTVVATDGAGNSGRASINVRVLPPLEFGATCKTNDECASGLCGRHSTVEDGYCTSLCEPDASTCPQQALCFAAGAKVHACGPPVLASEGTDPTLAGGAGSAGGCSVGSTPAAGLPSLLALLLLALVRRRR